MFLGGVEVNQLLKDNLNDTLPVKPLPDIFEDVLFNPLPAKHS